MENFKKTQKNNILYFFMKNKWKWITLPQLKRIKCNEQAISCHTWRISELRNEWHIIENQRKNKKGKMNKHSKYKYIWFKEPDFKKRKLSSKKKFNIVEVKFPPIEQVETMKDLVKPKENKFISFIRGIFK